MYIQELHSDFYTNICISTIKYKVLNVEIYIIIILIHKFINKITYNY